MATGCLLLFILRAVFLRNNLTAPKHKDFVSQAILQLLASECIFEHAVPPFCVNPFTVAEGKKLRLVIDLSGMSMNF